MHFPGALTRCTTNLANILRSSSMEHVIDAPGRSKSTLNMAKKVCFSRFFISLKKVKMNKGQMHFFENCCSVFVYVRMCRCGSVLLDYNLSSFRGPAQKKKAPFKVFGFRRKRKIGRKIKSLFVF